MLSAGIDFRSDRLWESYVTWETEQQKLAHVTAIYDRILAIPTQSYSQHFQRSGSSKKKKKKCGCHTTSPENHVPCSHFTKTDLVFNLRRFKEHVQSNNPKHFLSEEEFVQLRQELSKASLAQMGGEQDETPAVQEDLPPGTEDLSDPAKVQIQFQVLQEILTF